MFEKEVLMKIRMRFQLIAVPRSPSLEPRRGENSAVPAEDEVSWKVSPLVIWSSPGTQIFSLRVTFF